VVEVDQVLLQIEVFDSILERQTIKQNSYYVISSILFHFHSLVLDFLVSFTFKNESYEEVFVVLELLQSWEPLGGSPIVLTFLLSNFA